MAEKPFSELTLEEITARLANCEPGSVAHSQMTAEMGRRQFTARLEVMHAQKRAADAEMEAAQAARDGRSNTKKYNLHVAIGYRRCSLSGYHGGWGRVQSLQQGPLAARRQSRS